MRNFYDYVADRTLDAQKHRIASAMTEQGLEPYSYITEVLSEGWLGNFFGRLGQAWQSFWNKPEQSDDSPVKKLEVAKQAIADLEAALRNNTGSDRNAFNTALRGIEQALALINRVEPTIQQADDGVSEMLPPRWNRYYMAIMNDINRLIKQPKTEETAQQLADQDDKLVRLFGAMEDYIKKVDPKNMAQVKEKKQIERFLSRVFDDYTFREIMGLLKEPRTRQEPQQPQQVQKPQQAQPSSPFGSLGNISMMSPQLGQ
jgi:hypothetical protein